MKITLRPYAHDKTRWHVDIRLMNPCNSAREIRKRLVAPAHLSEQQARAWGERQVPKILQKVLGTGGRADVPSARKENSTGTARPHAVTLGEFYVQRFVPEHVELQKPATRVNYDSTFRNHFGPLLGDLPIAEIDEDCVMSFRAALRRRLKASTVNVVLAQLRMMLRFAKRVRVVAMMPDIERLSVPRNRPKPVYSDDQIELLVGAASSLSSEAHIICLLAVDMGLRVSEICALEWSDVDLDAGSITVQHNAYRGQTQTPKGVIGTLAMTSRLKKALSGSRGHEAHGPLVLYRRSQHTGMEWAPHTPHSVRYALNLVQRKAGMPISGPHLLRHTVLTRLARLGADVYEVQAVARHSRLETTQTYLHLQQGKLAYNAVSLLDRANKAAAGKRVAKRSQRPKN